MTAITSDFSTSTFDTDFYVSRLNALIDATYDASRPIDHAVFMDYAARLSIANIEHGEGGPFGALLVRYAAGVGRDGNGIGKPEVIGIGTNHVLPNNDPSAHAEMSAIRDASKRMGYSELSDTVLFSSCACCPMCLSSINASGVESIIYANTPEQAENIGFSDKKQYDLMRQPLAQYTTDVTTLPQDQRAQLLEKLGDHDAVVLDSHYHVLAYGDYGSATENDPTKIPSITAVQNACLARAKKGDTNEAVFDLPEDTIVFTRHIPHPAGLIALDWARVGRIRGDNPHNPADDKLQKDPAKILYLEPSFEPMYVYNKSGERVIMQDPEITLKQPALPDSEREIPTRRTAATHIQELAHIAFEQWKELGLVY